MYILEEEMATHSSILAWKIPWVEEPGGLQRVTTEQLSTHTQAHTHKHVDSRSFGSDDDV